MTQCLADYMVRAVSLLTLQPRMDAESFLFWTSLKAGSLCVTHYVSWSNTNRHGIATDWEVQ